MSKKLSSSVSAARCAAVVILCGWWGGNATAETVFLTPSDDAYVDSADVGGNHGWRDYLLAGEWDNEPPYRTCRGYLKFDLGVIPKGRQIARARLLVSAARLYSPPVTVGAHALATDTWGEMAITWNNAPVNFAPTPADSIAAAAGWNAWDVTTVVATEYAGDGTCSLVLRVPNEGVGPQGAWFDTKERNDVHLRPALEVVHVAAGAKLTELSGGHDSYVDSADAGGNHGFRDYLIVGDWDGESPYRICRTYMRFDLSSLPPDQTILNAELHMAAFQVGAPTATVALHYLGDDQWGENTITWNNAPTTYNRTPTDTRQAPLGHVMWSVTDDVDTVYHGDGLYSFVLRLPTEGAGGESARFHSDESTAALMRPMLRVVTGEACTGAERIKSAVCKHKRTGGKLKVVLDRGVAGDSYVVTLTTGEQAAGTLNNKGKAREKFTGLPAGSGTATARWGCGAADQADYACP